VVYLPSGYLNVREPTEFLSAMSAALTATATALLAGLQEFGATGMADMRQHTPYAIKDSMLHVSSFFFMGTLEKVELPK
jgi:hypothetical protein